MADQICTDRMGMRPLLRRGSGRAGRRAVPRGRRRCRAKSGSRRRSGSAPAQRGSTAPCSTPEPACGPAWQPNDKLLQLHRTLNPPGTAWFLTGTPACGQRDAAPMALASVVAALCEEPSHHTVTARVGWQLLPVVGLSGCSSRRRAVSPCRQRQRRMAGAVRRCMFTRQSLTFCCWRRLFFVAVWGLCWFPASGCAVALALASTSAAAELPTTASTTTLGPALRINSGLTGARPLAMDASVGPGCSLAVAIRVMSQQGSA